MLRKPFVISLAAVAAVLVVFYIPWLANNASFVAGDHNLFFEPFCRFIASQLREGHFPLWNPFASCGQSQVANPSPGLFYLPNAVFLLFRYSRSVALIMLFHQTVVMIGGYLLIREMGWRRAAAVFCGTALALNGFMFTITQNWTIAATAAWVPWCLLMQLRVAKAASLRASLLPAAGAAVAIAMMILGGRPEVWIIGAALSGLLAVCPTHRVQRATILAGAAGIVCGALIAMPAILPAAEWARISARTVKTLTSPLDWSAGWYDFFSIAFGQAFGDAFSIANPLLSLAQPVPGYAPFAGNFFLGPVALTLGALALCEPKWRWKWPVVGGLVVSVLLAAGANTALLPFLLKMAPPLAFVRYPVKLMFFVLLFLAILGARGVEALEDSARKAHWGFAPWGVLLVIGLGMLAFPNSSWFGMHELFASATNSFTAMVGIGALGIAISEWSIFILVYLVLMRSLSAERGPWIAVFVSVASMLMVAFSFSGPNATGSFYDKRSFAAEAMHQQGKRLDRLRQLALTPAPLLLPADFRPVDAAKLAMYNRQILAGNTGMDYRIGSLKAYEGAVTAELPLLESILSASSGQFQNQFDDRIAARICQMSATPFVITQITTYAEDAATNERKPFNQLRLDARYFDLVAEVGPLNMRIFRTKGVLPFAYFVTDWRWLPSRDDVLKVLAKDMAWDPHATALLIGSGAQPSPAQPALVAPKLSLGTPFPELLVADVECASDGVLVVADQYFPGWTATVDGARAEIVQSNLLFKGVLLKAGKHHVEFVFDPVPLRIGLYCCALGLVLVLLALLLSRR